MSGSITWAEKVWPNRSQKNRMVRPAFFRYSAAKSASTSRAIPVVPEERYRVRGNHVLRPLLLTRTIKTGMFCQRRTDGPQTGQASFFGNIGCECLWRYFRCNGVVIVALFVIF
jgi:hypothetical protein